LFVDAEVAQRELRREERDRLSLARQSARRDQFELEEKLGPSWCRPITTFPVKRRMRFNAHDAEAPMHFDNSWIINPTTVA
jgi:hypothetical protein